MHMMSAKTKNPRSPSVLMFPSLLFVPPALAWLLVAHELPGPVALTVVVLAVIAVVSGLEQAWPFRTEWNHAGSHERRTDLAYVALASAPDRLARVAVEAIGMAVVAGSVGASPSGPSAWFLGVGAFLIADLGKYVLHRAAHERPRLWRFHFVHHQPGRLVALNALRLHPVNMILNAVVDATAALAFSVPAHIAVVFATLRATVAVVQHANVELETQRQWLVNAPSYHRLHHAKDVVVAHHNYGATLLVWDRWFGTLLRGPAPAAVGVVTSHRQAQTYRGQLLQAFCTDRLDTTCVLRRWRWLTR